MSIEELKKIDDAFLPYQGEDKMNIFHQKESGIVVIIIYNPNILGITKLKDLLTLTPEGLNNLNFYYKTRDQKQLENIMNIFRVKKIIVNSDKFTILPLEQMTNKIIEEIKQE